MTNIFQCLIWEKRQFSNTQGRHFLTTESKCAYSNEINLKIKRYLSLSAFLPYSSFSAFTDKKIPNKVRWSSKKPNWILIRTNNQPQNKKNIQYPIILPLNPLDGAAWGPWKSRLLKYFVFGTRLMVEKLNINRGHQVVATEEAVFMGISQEKHGS